MALAKNRKEGIHPPALDGVGGFQEGNVGVYAAPTAAGDAQAVVPTGAAPWLSPPFGINQTAGFLGGTGTILSEPLDFARTALAKALLRNGQSSTRGGKLVASAAALGYVEPYVDYSFSAWILAVAEEAYTSTSTTDQIEVHVQPYFQPVVRPFFGFATAPTAGLTRYANGPSGAVSATAVQLAIVPFTGNVVRNLTIGLTTAPGVNESLVATIYRNPLVAGVYTGFVATTITCTVAGAAGLVAVDQTHSLALNQGDLIALQFVASNNGAYAAAGLSYAFDLT